jgi:hypothetical protein
MKHSELLANLNEAIANAKTDPIFMMGLRAVVELHKPTPEKECKECRAVTDCSECYGVEFVEAPYPCPTIQAIEKEL